MSLENLRTLKQFAAENPAFTEPGLRWLVFRADDNGMNEHGVIKRNGRRVLIDKERFAVWFEAQQGQAA